MANNATIGLAVAGGYLLGRTRKAKMAIGLGMFVAGRKLNLGPQLGKLVTDSPVLGEIGQTVRTQLVDATTAAASAALTRRANSLADALHERTLRIGGTPGTDPEDASSDAHEEADADDDRSFTAKGLDRVEFYFSANPGESVRPIAKVASGGELSRLMLILNTTTKLSEASKTMVFDEIDTGIGGRVAEAVGLKLKELAKTQQVLCVTHQPQVASLADQTVGASRRQPGELLDLVGGQLDAVRHQALAIRVVGAAAGLAVEETAGDVGPEDRPRLPFLKLVEAAASAPVAERFPLRFGHLGERPAAPEGFFGKRLRRG